MPSVHVARLPALVFIAALLASLVLASSGNVAVAEGPNAIVALPRPDGQDACRETVLPRNDDGSTSVVGLPFSVNFLGRSFSTLFVNNNGNVTFDAPLSTFTPFNLISARRVIVAPFFADVDTRGAGSDVVTYRSFGSATFGGRPTFCANWVRVGYFSQHTDKLNSFQLLLVDRSDLGPGDFDMIFNYDRIQWETGDASGGFGGLGGNPARIGYSNGSTAALELPGSGMTRAFLDSNTSTGLIHNSRNSTQLGRYIFAVRNGAAPLGATVRGTVYRNAVAAGNELGGAFVQVCAAGGGCNLSSTSPAGQYSVSGLPAGQYTVNASPPASSSLNPASVGPLPVSGTGTFTQNLVLVGPTPPPAGTTITRRATNPDGVPILYWGDPLTLTTQGCANAVATYEIRQGTSVVRTGSMTEGPAGTYTATIDPLRPTSGYARIVITIVCGGVPSTIAFDVYIDPSGVVRTTTGEPIAGATVVLFRSDSSGGPFVQVPDGSAIMSPANRRNPDATDASGRFGWDVVTGFYRVRASRQGCVSPTNPNQPFAESAVLTIPPPVTDLDLRLACPTTNRPPTANAGGPYSVAEGGTAQLAGSGSDPDNDALSFKWDLDGDGLFETVGQNATFSAAAIDGPATRTVALSACDPRNACSTATAAVLVLNAAPTITAITNSGPIDEGASATIHVTASDPAGAADPLRYAFDCDGDGVYEIAPQASGYASCSFDDNGTFTVRVSVTDDDGGAATGETSLSVTNVPPTVGLTPVPPAPWGMPIAFTASVSDPSSADTSAGFLFGWDFGDLATLTGTLGSATHTYETPRVYLLVVRATDKDGGTGTATTDVTVTRRQAILTCAGGAAPFGAPLSITAMLSDGLPGARLAGRTIRFNVGGEDLAATTSPNGSATVASPAFSLPGTYRVDVSLPNDTHYTADPSTCEVVRQNSVGKVTGGGMRMATAGRGGLTVQYDGTILKGEVQFQDATASFHGSAISALGIFGNGAEACFAGNGRLNGMAGHAFVACVRDGGEPADADVFRIRIDEAWHNGDGVLSGGNVQIHE